MIGHSVVLRKHEIDCTFHDKKAEINRGFLPAETVCKVPKCLSEQYNGRMLLA
jgi:hypothetical protein